MHSLKIDKITSPDILNSCATILASAYNAPPWNDEWTDEQALRKLLCFYNSPEFIGFTVYNGDALIGACAGNIEPYFTGDYFYLKEMFVSPAAQKMGAGRKLMEKLKDELQRRDVAQIVLFTSRAHFPFGFYERAGFTEIPDMVMMHFDGDNGAALQSAE